MSLQKKISYKQSTLITPRPVRASKSAVGTACPPIHCDVSCKSLSDLRDSWQRKPSPGTTKFFSSSALGNFAKGRLCRCQRCEAQNLIQAPRSDISRPLQEAKCNKKRKSALNKGHKQHICPIIRGWSTPYRSVRCSLQRQRAIANAQETYEGRWQVSVAMNFTEVKVEGERA